VVIKSGDSFFKPILIAIDMAPVICATATLWYHHLSRNDMGRTATALTRRSPGSSARTAASGIIAAAWDTSAGNLFANSVQSFFIDIWRFTCSTASLF